MALKQVILVRKDLEMSAGKLSSQTSHASVEATLKSKPEIIEKWRKEGAKKVILQVEKEEQLYEYKYKAEKEKIKTSLIADAGKTEIAPGTVTCLAIGPDEEKKIDKITGSLKMF